MRREDKEGGKGGRDFKRAEIKEWKRRGNLEQVMYTRNLQTQSVY